jgi:hypothetical protein
MAKYLAFGDVYSQEVRIDVPERVARLSAGKENSAGLIRMTITNSRIGALIETCRAPR